MEFLLCGNFFVLRLDFIVLRPNLPLKFSIPLFLTGPLDRGLLFLLKQDKILVRSIYRGAVSQFAPGAPISPSGDCAVIGPRPFDTLRANGDWFFNMP
jgi:hypothetical protein